MSEKVLKDFPKEIGNQKIDSIISEDLTQEIFIQEYVNKNKPCLIKNAIRHWPAMEKWKKQDYLSELVGEYELDVYSIRNHLNFKIMQEHGQQLKFSEGLRLAHQKGEMVVSMPANTIKEDGQFNELLEDIGSFSFLSEQPNPYVYDRNRFFAYKNAGTAWHLHPHDETLMCQVVGSKKVALLCSTHPDYSNLQSAFAVDNDKKYSLLLKENAKDLTLITVEEGDALYLPPYWFHGIDPVDSNFGVTLAHCWKSKIHKFGDMRYPSNKESLKGVVRCLPYIPNYYTLLLFSLCVRGLFLFNINILMKMFSKKREKFNT